MAELSKNSILYMPEGEVSGSFQILHDMADHQGRYRELAQFLSDSGYAVVTTDIKGHGNHVMRQNELGFFGDNAVSRIIGDVHDNTMYLKEKFPQIPCALIGQGMGALIATVYFKKYDNFLNGLFLSGMPSYRIFNPAAGLMLFVCMTVYGEYRRSRIIHYLLMSKYFARFRDEGSDHAWLTEDQDNINRYENDPKCGFIYTLNGYKTLSDLMQQAFGGISWIRKNKTCPVRLFYGSNDSCMLNKKALDRTVSLFTGNGYSDVSCSILPDQRHELFQDTKKETVMNEVVKIMKEISDRCKQKTPEITRPSHIIADDFLDPELETMIENEEEKINLEEFITSHSDGSGAKVEMIDFSESDFDSVPDTDNEELLDELLSGLGDADEASDHPSSSENPVDDAASDSQHFMIDPNNLDGIHE